MWYRTSTAAMFAMLVVSTRASSQQPPQLPAKGGWSLQMQRGDTCPAGTKTCFSDQTGVYSDFNRTGVDKNFSRGEECCPFGTSPRLDCGTYVNNGQPYACCPLGNADCRGDLEDPLRLGDEKCANPGWALWQIPDGGFNMFCCLPGQYGYWYESLGQDAVGMCSVSKILPQGSTPGVQFNNGDGSVSSKGNQTIHLPRPSPTPAPTCDIVHYGWSLQVDDEKGCTEGSNICGYGGACCPDGLNCGTVIGDSEVPVCCVPGNPDCRGDVEGLWPQLCADSSWALWHVNTNGNHFCCRPGQVGYNIPNDNAAVGFCGNRVPNGTMRSILDYEGDGSTAGAFGKFPCDSSPKPIIKLESIKEMILNPPKTLNPSVDSGSAVETGWYGNFSAGIDMVVVTIVKPWVETTYICPSSASETAQSSSEGVPVTRKFAAGKNVVKAGDSESGVLGVSTTKDYALPTEISRGGESTITSPPVGVASVDVSPSGMLFTGGSQKLDLGLFSFTLWFLVLLII